MHTYSPSVKEITRDWHIIDAHGQILGRIASKIAQLLMGKHKSSFTRHLDHGDHVVVINASQIKVTGKKYNLKLYRHHSGFPGGMKVTTFDKLQKLFPERIIIKAVTGMLPKNKLQQKLLKHLHVYSGSQHPYTSQFKITK